MTEVTQADEDAAAQAWVRWHDTGTLAQAFARHRTTAEAAKDAFPGFRWPLGTRVRKTKGSSWQGRVVGFYSTSLTAEGYAVESEREPGSVQIYPVGALQEIDNG